MLEAIQNLLERENINPASNARRVAAYFIDVFLADAIFIAIHIDALPSSTMPYTEVVALTQQLMMAFLWQYLLIRFAYETFFTYKYGGSVGKILLKIRVIRADLPDNLSLSQSAWRAALKILQEMVFTPLLALAFVDPVRRCLHDRALKSLVVNEF